MFTFTSSNLISVCYAQATTNGYAAGIGPSPFFPRLAKIWIWEKMVNMYVGKLPKTKKFDCVGRGDLTSLFFSKVVKY